MEKLFESLKEKLGEEVFTEEAISEMKAHLDVQLNEEVQKRVEVLKTELEESNTKDLSEFKNGLIENLDGYLDYAAEEFFKKNKIALESEYKVSVAEELQDAIKSVLGKYNIEFTSDQEETIKNLEEDFVTCKEKLNESVNSNIELKKQCFEYEKTIKFKNMTSEFSAVKTEKILDLMEGLEYSDIEDFEHKVGIVIEKVKNQSSSSFKSHDEFEELDESVNFDIDRYLA